MSKVAKIDTAETLPADPMVSMIERVALDPSSDLAKLEKMLDMKERHEAAEARAAFAAAFSKATAELPTIPLNGKGHNNKPYATLEDITKLTRPVLSENGLALTFAIDVGTDVVVTAKLMHKSGHVETTSIALPRDTGGAKNAVQSVGSSQTYGQRYTAQAILGLSLGNDVEDDGRATGAPVDSAPKKQYSWAATITDELPENATPQEKAEAVANALVAQFKRMKGERQISNEWDRRASIIEGLEERFPELHMKVIDAYELRLMEIKDGAGQ
ncbi:ERF family protein [Halocynthiibacter sp. C4]|uniref:ERF family protein n=1 Tax=Halocynthiibacter sp. C4 TaxID=2992758 RepID=UPI00237BABBD|nr:ERF family protein [Halocynthiibacter sp. C4]MDE0590448.1 ERF family protein [Halocynthiibacter sp. C4]